MNYYRTRSAATARQREEHYGNQATLSQAVASLLVLYLRRDVTLIFGCGLNRLRNRRNLWMIIRFLPDYYLLTTSTTNESGLIVRCGLPPAVAAGVSRYSAALRNIFPVFESKAIVLALG